MNLRASQRQLGQDGEAFASRYAEVVFSWKILERNARFKCGEIDVIFLDEHGDLVFVEVKTRSGHRFGSAMESLTPQKIQRFKKACLEWFTRDMDSKGERSLQSRRHFRMECFAVQVERGVWSLERFVME